MSDLIMVSAADMAVLNLLRSYAPLRRELERAIVVSSAAMPPDVATLDSRVRYRDETEGVTRTISLVYPSQADAAKARCRCWRRWEPRCSAWRKANPSNGSFPMARAATSRSKKCCTSRRGSATARYREPRKDLRSGVSCALAMCRSPASAGAMILRSAPSEYTA